MSDSRLTIGASTPLLSVNSDRPNDHDDTDPTCTLKNAYWVCGLFSAVSLLAVPPLVALGLVGKSAALTAAATEVVGLGCCVCGAYKCGCIDRKPSL